MKTYVFRVEIEKEEDGRWSAVAPALAGCATWGHTPEEALRSIQEAVNAYIDVLREDGKEIPTDSKQVEIIDSPVVAVTV